MNHQHVQGAEIAPEYQWTSNGLAWRTDRHPGWGLEVPEVNEFRRTVSGRFQPEQRAGESSTQSWESWRELLFPLLAKSMSVLDVCTRVCICSRGWLVILLLLLYISCLGISEGPSQRQELHRLLWRARSPTNARAFKGSFSHFHSKQSAQSGSPIQPKSLHGYQEEWQPGPARGRGTDEGGICSWGIVKRPWHALIHAPITPNKIYSNIK